MDTLIYHFESTAGINSLYELHNPRLSRTAPKSERYQWFFNGTPLHFLSIISDDSGLIIRTFQEGIMYVYNDICIYKDNVYYLKK